jgi:hypothetical protein
MSSPNTIKSRRIKPQLSPKDTPPQQIATIASYFQMHNTLRSPRSSVAMESSETFACDLSLLNVSSFPVLFSCFCYGRMSAAVCFYHYGRLSAVFSLFSLSLWTDVCSFSLLVHYGRMSAVPVDFQNLAVLLCRKFNNQLIPFVLTCCGLTESLEARRCDVVRVEKNAK